MENEAKGTYGVRGSPKVCGYSAVMHRYYCADSRYST
jgi:hypothetical protein